MTEEEYKENYPDLDSSQWEEIFLACFFAIKQLYIAELKEKEDSTCSAIEHRSAAWRRLVKVLNEVKPRPTVEESADRLIREHKELWQNLADH